jgi:hypothetical protein
MLPEDWRKEVVVYSERRVTIIGMKNSYSKDRI